MQKNPKKFSWKVTVKQKPITNNSTTFQEQCSCGSGGGSQCHGQCGG